MTHLTKRPRQPLEIAVSAAMVAMASTGSGVAMAQQGAQGAQGAQGRQLEEIVVTTERRLNTEATTAISIEVLSDEFLASNQIKDIIDLQNAVPALQFFQNGSYVQANIRGVGNPSTGGPSEQVGVPVFFDGATQGEEMSLASGFFDVGDVQVLRGPQGTFVGQSAAGGAILINSARPDFDGISGYGELTVGNYNVRKVTGAVNVPIAANFAARLAYMSENRDSFYSNAGGNRTAGQELYTPGDQQDDNFRLGMLWEPNEQFSLYAKLERTELHGHGIPQQPNPNFYTGYRDDDDDPQTPSIAVKTYDRHAQGPAPGTGIMVDHDNDPLTPDIWYDGVPGPGGAIYDPLDPWTIDHRNDEWRVQTNNRVSLEMNYTLDSGITVRSLTSTIEMNRRSVEGGDSAVYSSPNGFELGPGMLTWSQEFNIISPEGQRLEWLVGAYKSDRHTELEFGNALGNPLCGWDYDASWTPCPTSGTRAGTFFWSSTDDVVHTALFGQVNFDLTDTVQLTFEGRLNDDDNVQVRAPFVFATATAPDAANPVPCPAINDKIQFYCPDPTPDWENPQAPLIWKGDIPTYKVGINWEPRDGHFFYAFLARGYKSGQSTALLGNQIVEEVVDDFEIGWKATLRPGLYAEFGIYSMDYTDMQMSVFRTAQTESDTGTTNIGDSKIEGFEGSLRAVFGGFGINASFAYNNSELGAITTIDTRALPINSAGGVWAGDIAKGCEGSTVGLTPECFDYTDYFITLTGSENLFAPELTYTLSVDYVFNLRSGATLTPRLSLNHSDSAYESVLQQPTDRYYQTDDRDILNLSLSYNTDLWDVQVFANNLSDELYLEGVGNGVLYGEPRTVGFRARRDF